MEEADIINHQRAQLAVQQMQKKYCTKEVSTKFSDTGASTSTSTSTQPPQPPKKQAPKKPQETTSSPLTLTKNPHKMEPQNHACEVLCLPGTTENNLKASRLNMLFESEFNLYKCMTPA